MTATLRPHRRASLAALLAFTVGVTLPEFAPAQAWPAKPIRVIVGFPPGGAADQIARLVSQPLQDALGQPVVVENKTGAGGNVAGDLVAKSAPDGYTLLMSSGGMVSVNPHIYPKLSFDPSKDLTPVAAAARVSVYLVVKPEFPANNVQEFVTYAKANPGKLSFGSCRKEHLSFSQVSVRDDTYGASARFRMMPSSFIWHATCSIWAGVASKVSLKRMRSPPLPSSSWRSTARRDQSGTARKSRSPR